MPKETRHEIFFENSANMKSVEDGSVQLVVTSPPYPMIEMWDDVFSGMNAKTKIALDEHDGNKAFETMHRELDKVWRECHRVLCDGGIACINIGDAVRTINKVFKLYNSHSRITTACIEAGFQCLPAIIWRKQTNAPNKFMGSGMLPPGAYVTLEHEFILVFRKGGKREFKPAEKENRRESAFFWEERNNWFSDVWFDLKGTTQKLLDKETRERSAAFPFELPYRLINMFSVKGDTVLDPFLGTAMTTAAAMASERNSIGCEIDPLFAGTIDKVLSQAKQTGNSRIGSRLETHESFVSERAEQNKSVSKTCTYYGFSVVSGQEEGIIFREIAEVSKVQESSSRPGSEKQSAAAGELDFSDNEEPSHIPKGPSDVYIVSYIQDA